MTNYQITQEDVKNNYGLFYNRDCKRMIYTLCQGVELHLFERIFDKCFAASFLVSGSYVVNLSATILDTEKVIALSKGHPIVKWVNDNNKVVVSNLNVYQSNQNEQYFEWGIYRLIDGSIIAKMGEYIESDTIGMPDDLPINAVLIGKYLKFWSNAEWCCCSFVLV